jgi:hypothetical protein
MKIKHFFVIILLLTCQNGNAQFGIGFHCGLANWLNTTGYTENGKPVEFTTPQNGTFIGLEATYVIKKKIRIDLSADFVNNDFQVSTVSTPYTDNFGMRVTNTTSVKHPANFIWIESQYALKNDFLKQGFSISILGGLGYNIYNYSTSYVSNAHSQTGTPHYVSYGPYNKTYSGLSFCFGSGIEYALNYTTHIFIDLRLCSGAETNFDTTSPEYNQYQPENFNPFYLSTALGLRFNLNEPKE